MSLLFWSAIKLTLQFICLIFAKYIRKAYKYESSSKEIVSEKNSYFSSCTNCGGSGIFRNDFDIRSYRIYDYRDDYIRCSVCYGSGYNEIISNLYIRKTTPSGLIFTSEINSILFCIIFSLLTPPGLIYAVILKLNYSLQLLDIVFLINIFITYFLQSFYFSFIILFLTYLFVLAPYFIKL